VIFFHSALSSHCFLHRLTPIICKSSSLPAIHLFRGLPLVLVPIGFHCNILLGVLLSSIRITWRSRFLRFPKLITKMQWSFRREGRNTPHPPDFYTKALDQDTWRRPTRPGVFILETNHCIHSLEYRVFSRAVLNAIVTGLDTIPSAAGLAVFSRRNVVHLNLCDPDIWRNLPDRIPAELSGISPSDIQWRTR
jgi:hypothetical protein